MESCTCSSSPLADPNDYSTHVTLRCLPRSLLLRSLRQSVRGTSSLGPFSACSLLPGVNLRREETSLPLPPSEVASNLPSPFLSSLPLAFALPVSRFLLAGELSSNSSETSGCRSSSLSARLPRLSCHCRLLWKAVESQSSYFSTEEDLKEETGTYRISLSVSPFNIVACLGR